MGRGEWGQKTSIAVERGGHIDLTKQVLHLPISLGFILNSYKDVADWVQLKSPNLDNEKGS